MKKKTHITEKPFLLVVVFLAAAFILMAVCLALSGCSVEKGKHTKKSDTVDVSTEQVVQDKKKEQGAVSTTTSTNSVDSDWWRVITQYSAPRDTNVTNVYPTTIIQEGGKIKQQSANSTTDSSWLQEREAYWLSRFDSLSQVVAESSKQKETAVKGLGVVGVILSVVIGYLIMKGLGILASKFKVVKR